MGPREQRSYSEDETDRSARTGGLGRPKDEDFESLPEPGQGRARPGRENVSFRLSKTRLFLKK